MKGAIDIITGDEKNKKYYGVNITVLSAEKQKELLAKAQEGDIAARNELMMSNIPFVIKIAKQYKRTGANVDELISEGCLGLHKAIEKFDINKQNNYISYAVWWIRYYIARFIQNNNSIRKPVNKIREINNINRLKTKIKKDHVLRNMNEVRQEKYIANELQLPVKYLKYLMSTRQDVISLDKKSSNYQSEEINRPSTIDTVADREPTPEKNYIEKEMKDFLRYCINSLPRREAEIIKLRYGFNTGKPKSLEQLSEMFNLSKERIRQLEIKVKGDIKRMFSNYYMKKTSLNTVA